MSDIIPHFETCIRCNDQGFERLQTYGHCVNCNYVIDFTEEANHLLSLRKYLKDSTGDESDRLQQRDNVIPLSSKAPTQFLSDEEDFQIAS